MLQRRGIAKWRVAQTVSGMARDRDSARETGIGMREIFSVSAETDRVRDRTGAAGDILMSNFFFFILPLLPEKKKEETGDTWRRFS